MAWLWLVGALFLGGALLVVAVTFDARRRRELERAASAVPLRDDERVDRHRPRYVTQEEIDAMAGQPGAAGRPEGRRFDFGLAHPDLAADGGAATLEAPRVLLVEGDVTSMRQLLPVLGDGPLLLVADGVGEEVGRTLGANRRALHMPVLACEASPGDLIEVRDFVGGEILSGDDLRAGYTPASAFGHVAAASADARHTWLRK